MKKVCSVLMFCLSLNLFASEILSSYFVTSNLEILSLNTTNNVETGSELTFKIKSFNMLNGQIFLVANVVDGNTNVIIPNSAMAVQCQIPGDNYVVYPNVNARLMPQELYCTLRTKYLKNGSFKLFWNLFKIPGNFNNNVIMGSGFSPKINLF